MRSPIYFITHPKDLLSSTLKKTGKYIPDRLYLKLLYRLAMDHKLNLVNPTTFTEKLQWRKIHNRKPGMTTMADKYAVKEYGAKHHR